jgi:hypothetical protein
MILYDLAEKILPRFPEPPVPAVVLSPIMYAHKSAYRIDPLLAENVIVLEPQSHPRFRREIYASEFKEY